MRSHNVFCNLVSEATCHHFCHILLVQCGKIVHENVDARMGESLRAISVAGYRYRPDISSSRMDSSLVGKLWLTCSLDTELLAIIAFGRGGQEDELRKPVMTLGFLRRSIYSDKSRPESGHW